MAAVEARQPRPSRRRFTAGRGLLVAVGIGLTAAFAALLVARPVAVELADLRLYDLMLAGRGTPARSGVPVLVGIDERSLAAYGQWPWPRYRLAMLVDRLRELGADAIALDILMPEPDRSSPEVIRAERVRDRVEPGLAAAADRRDSNSERLAAALSGAKTVLADHLDFSASPPPSREPPPAVPDGTVVIRAVGGGTGRPAATGAIRSLPALTAAAGAEGFTNTGEDRDGTLRRTPLLLALGGREHPSLALAASLIASPDRRLKLVGEGGETSLVWAGRSIPLDPAGNLLVDFRDESSIPYHSARTVLEGRLAPGSLKGKIVFVGSWATGLGDLHLVPSGRWVRGLEVHATVADNLLAGTFIARPGWAAGAEFVAVLLLGVATTLLLSRSGFRVALLAVVGGSAGCYGVGRQLLVAGGLHVSPLMPMLTLIAVTTVLSLLKYGIEARKVRQGIEDLVHAQDGIIVSLSVLSEARDRETGLHILRTQRYVEILARQLATTPKYADLDESRIRLLAKSAPLHDIGKVGIPDAILKKPGKLSEDEFAVMRSHTLIGANALTRIADFTGSPEKSEFLHYAREMTESHHERWDGTGYPHGLQGDAIPLAGRLMALADVYDALISPRVYKKAFSHADVCEHIRQGSGGHFDPDVVAAFMARDREFLAVAERYAER